MEEWRVLYPNAAQALASKVAAQLDLRGPVELLRSGANHVYRVDAVVVRISPPTGAAIQATALAEKLIGFGVPVLRPRHDMGIVEGAHVSVWEYLDPATVDFCELGRTTAQLHRILPEALEDVVPLPWFGEAEWLRLEEKLDQAAATGVVDDADIEILRQRCRAVRGWSQLDPGVEVVLCHGDLHPDNVLMRDGQAVLIDWDQICLGPPAWDHAALMTWPERWGGGADDYQYFAAGYGADLRGDALARRLAEVRLLGPTINMVIAGATSERHARQARLRMRYWQGDPTAPPWTAQ